MNQALTFAVLGLVLSGCALVKTTKEAKITSWGISAVEPLTGTMIHMGYFYYERKAEPEQTIGTQRGTIGK